MAESMRPDQRAKLAAITRFDQLIAYLRDEMGWPISRDSFEDVDDLFYDFTADELGIDLKNAAKIEEIKRLRPLSANQPWGVFFIKFEPKTLPVMALRRILSRVAIKKRPSANSAERTAWAADDLLFVSNYGEGDRRQISFAHFSQTKDRPELPTLKVLGWDNLNTALHLDAVVRELTQHLAWPDDDTDLDAWRQQWRAAFTLRHREVITTSRELSIRLAKLAGDIRDRIKSAVAIETTSGQFTMLMRAFQASMVHDLDVDGFADMYAQTIAYGLLSARIADPHRETGDDFAAHMRTNPFLRELMEAFLKVGERRGKAGGPGIDFDELGVNEVVELLDHANMEAVVRDFGDRNPQEDPVIHFYELFLKEYDAKRRMQLGVFYTPRPVVSYIVRSVDELLRTEFGLEDGLADTATWGEVARRRKGLTIPAGTSPDHAFVQILDPATGTGTFLVEAIDIIHKTLVSKWKAQGHGGKQIEALWNDYVPKYLLTRLHGYELLMAPYAIAHLKLGLKLYETGYRFGSDVRVRVYLTNALEPGRDFSSRIRFTIPALAHEAHAVNEVKRHGHFTVVIGNPPYAGHSQNNDIPSIVELVRDFTRDDPSLQGPGQGKWLQDDYVKFLRLGQALIDRSAIGILAMITNHRYLTNRTFRSMRRLWRDRFPLTRILDLHGNRVVHEVSPLGNDDNVFDIFQGVAIGLFARGSVSADIKFFELWGARRTADKKGKYDFLAAQSLTTTPWASLAPAPPEWLFSPRDEVSADIRSEFEAGMRMAELMPGALGPNGKPQSGLATMHDAFAISFTPGEVEEKIGLFLGTSNRDQAKALFGTLCNPQQWDYATAKRVLAMPEWRARLSPIAFSPFDVRYTVYDRSVAVHLRRRLSDHLFGHDNLGLVIGEAGQEISGDQWDAVSCVNSILQLNYFRRNGSPTLPLYLYGSGLMGGGRDRQPNLSESHLRQFANRLTLPVADDGMPEGVTPEDIFHYAYAVLHSPGYRKRYAEFLKTEFPRLPVTGRLSLFRQLSALGGDLTSLHLLKGTDPGGTTAPFIGPGTEVEKASWSRGAVWIDKAQTTGFMGVSEQVWNFHIGGYQVCEKWLKDRRGRTLTAYDIAHYQKIVIALSETIRLMKEIDEVIEQHGGWPDAFGR